MTIDDPTREGFLARWSRRKRAVEDEEATPVVDEPETEDAQKVDAEIEEPKSFDPADLPDVETLGPGSDFKPFMQKGVPAALKQAALRKLWRSNPVLANVDGLVDYGEDFTNKATVIEGLKTAYRVGRGMVKKLDEIVESDADRDGDEPATPEKAEVTADTDAADTIPVADDRNRS